MISCLVVGAITMYTYFASERLIFLFLSILLFLLAAGCHQRLIKRVEFLEKQMSGVISSLEKQVSVNKSCYQVVCKLSGYKDVREDDLK